MGRRGEVRLVDLTRRNTAALGELTTRLAQLDLASVDVPWWALRPDSPVHGAARRTAVHDAVRRARAYAEALDATLVALVELSDSSLNVPVPADYDPHDRSSPPESKPISS